MNPDFSKKESAFSSRNILLVLVFALVAGIVNFLYSYFQIGLKLEYNDPSNKWIYSSMSMASTVIRMIVLWLIVYRVSKDFRASVSAFILNILIIALYPFLKFESSQNFSIVFNHLGYFLFLLPYAVFMFLHTKSPAKTGFIVLIMYFFASNSLAYFGIQPMSDLFTNFLRIFNINYDSLEAATGFIIHYPDGGYSQIAYLPVVLNVMVSLAAFLVQLEILRIVSLYRLKDLGDTKLELSVTYSKAQVLLTYFSTRILLDCAAFGLIGNIYFKNSMDTTSKYIYIYGFWAVTSVVTFYFFLWFHRKVLLEYLYSRNRVPSWFYYSLVIPVLNFIIFPIGVFCFGKSNEISNRRELLKESYSLNSAGYIGALIIIFQAIALIIAVVKTQWTDSFIRLIILLFMVALISGKRFSYYVIIGFYTLMVLFHLLSKEPGLFDKGEITVAIPLAIIAFYMMYAVFFIDNFSELKEEEGLDAGRGESILAEKN